MSRYLKNPDAYLINEEFEKFANKHGWVLDTSCETENSDFVYYWNNSLIELKMQEDLMEYLDWHRDS